MKNLKLINKKDENGILRKTKITIDNITIGTDFLVIAGPCSIESETQILSIAKAVKEAGANMLRGGAYKPRTSPYSFQGLGRVGLEYLKKAKEETKLPIITEVTDTRDVYLVSEYADILQIGARNMQNFSLLIEVGKLKKPILLKRGMNATIEEWLNCAEYIMKSGNPNVILCERGIRTFELYTRNTLDLSAVVAVKQLTHLPIIVDPSPCHWTGRFHITYGFKCCNGRMCDGLEIEVHPCPSKAFSDKEQQLNPQQFFHLMKNINKTLTLRNSLDY